jgi:outer membrane PBP1 activator LpoA protein
MPVRIGKHPRLAHNDLWQGTAGTEQIRAVSGLQISEEPARTDRRNGRQARAEASTTTLASDDRHPNPP